METVQHHFTGFVILFVLGLRHGLDPDHITIIDGYTYRLHLTRNNWARWVGTLFTFGHGIMVTAIALTLSILKNNFEMPAMLDILVEWASSMILFLAGISNLMALTRQAPASSRGLKKWLIPSSFKNNVNPCTVIITGIIFGFIFDTSSQIAAFGYAISVSNQWMYAILGGTVFSLGLIITGTCDSMLLSKLLKAFDQKKIQSHRFRVTILITIMCFAIPVYKIISTLHPELELSDSQNNIIGITFIGIIMSLYADLYLRHRLSQPATTIQEDVDLCPSFESRLENKLKNISEQMNLKMDYKTVSIVGAGPGDPELLTVRAYNRIKGADVILHDNLIPEEILSIAGDAEKIYVGRKYADPHDQNERQDHINELMELHASQGKKVVRLKSGDSFIYGRAMEEVRFLTEKHLPFELVPGITAGIAAANFHSIALTERNKSNSVLFCTGHTSNYSFEQWDAISNMLKTGTSLIMYMGLKSLHRIIPRLNELVPDTVYISAVSRVSYPDEQIVSGTLKDIEHKLSEMILPMPVVFILGKYSFPLGNERRALIREFTGACETEIHWHKSEII